jgi:murein DD-endopeptidase MepM/ murein hydrolase activator NlpD
MKNQITTKIASAILTLGLLAGCASRNGPPASVHYDKAVSPYHVVKKGDSIASIAQKYGMDKRELIRVNGLESPYRIVKGQRLLVRPTPKKSSEQDDQDDQGAPATEEVGSVPEDEEGVNVKLLPGGPEQGAGLKENRFKGESDDGYAEGEGGASLAAPQAAAGYTWPTQGAVTRTFNPAGQGKAQNDGINIAAAKGSPVVAANNGVVAHAGNQLRGFGNVVLVKHDNEMMTVYAHLDKVSVKKGDVVNAGQKLGTVGQTGTVKEPQLHFEIRKGRKPIDPGKYLN